MYQLIISKATILHKGGTSLFLSKELLWERFYVSLIMSRNYKKAHCTSTQYLSSNFVSVKTRPVDAMVFRCVQSQARGEMHLINVGALNIRKHPRNFQTQPSRSCKLFCKLFIQSWLHTYHKALLPAMARRFMLLCTYNFTGYWTGIWDL